MTINSEGIAHVHSTPNNTIITLSDIKGKVIGWASSGCISQFKGARRSTSYAAQLVAEKIVGLAKQNNIKTLQVWVRGFGEGRESAIRGLNTKQVKVHLLKDVTSIAHGGCRPKKRRRI